MEALYRLYRLYLPLPVRDIDELFMSPFGCGHLLPMGSFARSRSMHCFVCSSWQFSPKVQQNRCGGAWLMAKMYFIIDCHTSPSWPNWWRFQTSTEHPSTSDDGVPARARKLPITKLALSEGLPRLDDQLDLRMTRVVNYIHPPKFDIDTRMIKTDGLENVSPFSYGCFGYLWHSVKFQGTCWCDNSNMAASLYAFGNRKSYWIGKGFGVQDLLIS